MEIRQRHLPGISDNSAQFGNWIGKYSPVPVRGTILSVNPVACTCVVKTEFGNFLPNVALPNLDQDPDGGGGTLNPTRRGQEVLVQFGISHPFIVQFCPSSVDIDLDAPESFRLTEIELNNVLTNGDATNYAGRMPSDAQPGDWAKVGNQGQRLGVLDGGVCVMGSSPWSQIYTIASPEKDLTRVVGRHMQLFSQFGVLEFGEDGGKTWMKLEGGTDQLTESTVSPANPTFRMLVGGDSGGMFSLQAFNREGAPVYEHIVDYDGAENSNTTGGLTSVIGGAFVQDIASSRSMRVLTGDDSLIVQNGNRIERYRGNQNTGVSGRKTTNVGGNATLTSQRDIAFTASRHMKFNAGGDLKAKKGDVAAQWNISNGSMSFEIGNPISLDNQVAMSSFLVRVLGGGNINLSTFQPQSKIILGSTGPGSVLLGVDPFANIAPYHAVKWETLLPILQALATAIDTHPHTVFGAVPVDPTLVKVTPIITPMLQLCKSLTVKLGPL